MTPDTAFILCRFVFDGAALFLWGSAVYLWLLVPRGLSSHIAAKLRRAHAVAVVLAVIATAALLPVRSAMLGNGWADGLDAETTIAVLTGTSIGTAWAWQAALSAVLLAVTWMPVRRKMAATAIISGLLLCGLALTGHAAMNDGGLGLLHRANDMVHVLAGGAWIGALAPVALVLSRLGDRTEGAEALMALIRFSRAGHVAVALVILSGLTNSLLITGGLPLDWSVPYQRLLSLKICLVAIMVLMAIFNRYELVPRIGRSPTADRALAAGTVAEMIVATGIIALVAWLGTLEPFPG
ncbi:MULTISPECIES: copper homeostasis membrane protein CopD [unclassified Rhizobium]|uniref:copper homeostasis membrane protein CopD n=1 Tax=unclassified Rhizobium TaxID=2613769 RepID=UPI00104D44A9|nr:MULTISPECIES: copper homeostasis membrane protein CopD [unclassified Rhizobium]TCS05220.1 putative copper resistance protein D [Rhizobium sp. BK418]